MDLKNNIPLGGRTLKQKSFDCAYVINSKQLGYRISPKTKFKNLGDVAVYENGIKLDYSNLSSLNVTTANGFVTLNGEIDLTKTYELELVGFGKKLCIPTAYFDTKEFNDKYAYDGTDLGAVIKGGVTEFKVWAPTASLVMLNLFDDGALGDAKATIKMQRQDKGVWCASVGVGHGTYYTYTVTTALGTKEAVDPYAKAVGVNGNRGMVVDLNLTNPDGFLQDGFANNIESYSDAVIWEIHVRDFSNKLKDSNYKGKYLAFTERGLKNSSGVAVGLDYITNLGVTHIHLLPSCDFATVDETGVGHQFNWGYDPKNYNAPEGSYSTDPYHGEVRINEFKQMVKALHQQGLAVVMDVVYNHTYDSDSCFNRIVPYYYYRYDKMGKNSNGSGCGNETASDRYMFRKFMVDSVTYWAKEYHVDGFRFDLMGLHDVETMQQIEKAVHLLNPKAILYGEGWTGGDTPLAQNKRAVQSNIKKIKPSIGAIGGVAVFNDALRDALKGSVFDKHDKGFVSGKVDGAVIDKIKFSLEGGKAKGVTWWSVENACMINYMSCHDNNTLWDKLLISNPNVDLDSRLKMNRLAIAIVMVSKGIPFMQAGEEMLRSKNGEENSYNLGDDINNLDWEKLTPQSPEYKMMTYYKGLIAMRKEYKVFRGDDNAKVKVTTLPKNLLKVELDDKKGNKALILINPNDFEYAYTLDDSWLLIATDSEVLDIPIKTPSNNCIHPKGISVFVRRKSY